MPVPKPLLLLIFVAIPVISQIPTENRHVQELAKIIRSGSTQTSLEAILAAGRSADRNYESYLRSIAEPEKVSYAVKSIPAYAQVALAMLGDKGYLTLILQEVDSENIFLQNAGIEKLSLVGGPKAFKTFLRLLDDTKVRREIPSFEETENARAQGLRLRTGDEILEPRSILVMRKLSTMVIDPPIPPDGDPTLADIKVWKDWFRQHSELIR